MADNQSKLNRCFEDAFREIKEKKTHFLNQTFPIHAVGSIVELQNQKCLLWVVVDKPEAAESSLYVVMIYQVGANICASTLSALAMAWYVSKSTSPRQPCRTLVPEISGLKNKNHMF